LTARTASAATASGTIASEIDSGVVQRNPTAAATTPPRAAPPIRSSARKKVSAKNGCMVATIVIPSQ
jgi:hypothetical protein